MLLRQCAAHVCPAGRHAAREWTKKSVGASGFHPCGPGRAVRDGVYRAGAIGVEAAQNICTDVHGAHAN